MKKKNNFWFLYEVPTGIYKGITRDPDEKNKTDKTPFFDSSCFTCFDVLSGEWNLISRDHYYEMQAVNHEVARHDNRVIDLINNNTGLLKYTLDKIEHHIDEMDAHISLLNKDIIHHEHSFKDLYVKRTNYLDHHFQNILDKIDSKNVIIRNLIEMRETQFQMMFTNLMNRLDYHHRSWYQKLLDWIY